MGTRSHPERLALGVAMLLQAAGLTATVILRRRDRAAGCRPSCVCGAAC